MDVENKFYWTVNPETNEVNQQKNEAIFTGGQYHIPCNALLTEPLPEKQGYAVIAKSDLSGTEYTEDYRKRIVYKKTDKSQLKIKQLGAIPNGYTALVPQQFDEWINGEWVRNAKKEHEYYITECDQQRLSEYQQKVDPLLSEAIIKRLMGNNLVADTLEQKALENRAKIQKAYPWPMFKE